MDAKSFGEIIKDYRLQNNMQQKTLASKVKCSNATLSKVEGGHQEAKSPLVFKLLAEISPDIKTKLIELEITAELKRNYSIKSNT